jgi:release factor glutamine methyltransferase
MPPRPTGFPIVRAALTEAERVLAAGPHRERARRDAATLLLHALRESMVEANLAWLIAHQDDPLACGVAERFRILLDRRRAGEPMQYITGEAEFYGLKFAVNREVLIPRPETELLVERAILVAGKLRQDGLVPEPRIVDVGTGSGAIAVSLAHAFKTARVMATEISPAALAVARANAARNGVAERVRFLEGDLLEPVAGETFHFVVSNPPYVPERDRASLAVEVRDFEPAQALYAGEDGLSVYRRLIPEAFAVLKAGGFLLLEIGYGQRAAIEALLKTAGFGGIEFAADLQGIPRVALARRDSR